MRLKTLAILLLALLLLLSAGCRSKNVGDEGPIVTVAFSAPVNGWLAGEVATMTVDWAGTGMAPFTIAIDMGGGTTEDVPAGTAATSPYTMDFTLVGGGPYTYTVTVTDANALAGIATGTYMVGTFNQPPAIIVAVMGSVVTVSVTDADGDDVMVEVTDIEGMTVNTNSVAVAGGNGDAVFTFSADNPFDGAAGTTTISAYDDIHAGAPVTDTADVIITDGAHMPPAGALAAIPVQTTAAVGDTVIILVMAGDFPADAAFAFLNGVAVTTPDGGDYVYETMNVGTLGGGTKATDGIWEGLSPAAKTYLLPEDYMMEATDVAEDSALDYMGFNVTPLEAGGEITDGGMLFNFGMSFSAAGTYALGFLEFQDVKRTYYSDAAAAEFNWSDLSNDYEGLPNTVVVN